MSSPDSISTAQAYRHCESLTRAAAANFYYGIRLLPADKRRAMCAVYAFARRIDDIGDGSLEVLEKLTLLDAARRSLQWDPASREDQDAVIVALAHAHTRFGLPVDALEDLIDGVRMDVEGATYETFEDLLLYCRRVAGSIGRLCLAIFGVEGSDHDAGVLADDLGVAMQLTNILRDLREDAQRGRVYLPASDLRRYHLGDDGALGPVALDELAAEASRGDPQVVAGFGGGEVGQLYALTRFQARRAHEWFERGMALVPLLDRRSAACVLAMSGIYRGLLTRIEDRPDLALGQRMSLPTRRKAWVAARSVLLRRPAESRPAQRSP
jgi:phytoene synthase